MNIRKRTLGSPAVASTTGVKTAVTDNGSAQEITSNINNPAVPRNITATAGGTSTDVKAIKVTVYGTNVYGEEISEEIGPFTENATGTKEGSKAFKTVTKIKIPAHDGTGATTAIGFGEKLGLGVCLSYDSVINAYLNNVCESTRPTVVFDGSLVEGNTVDLNSTCNGNPVFVTYHTTR